MTDTRLPELLAFARDPRVEAGADLVVKAAAVLGMLMLLAGYLALPALPIFGHDEVHYYVDFRFKLAEDGRWLDFLLHHFLRSVPLPLWSLVYLSLWWVLLYRIARGFIVHAPLAALLASTVLLTSPFLEISLWPASVVPALLIASLALVMQARGVAYQVIYLVSGMLLFGAMTTLYFMLPLLFLPQFLATNEPLRARLLLLLKHMLWWVGGSVAGVLVVCVMLRLLAGIWFPQPPAWRNVQPISDVAGLVGNIQYAAGQLRAMLKMLLITGGFTWTFIALLAAVALLRVQQLFAQLPAWLLLLAVLVSFFLFSIPLAPVIHMRSLIAMATVVVFSLVIIPGPSAAGRILAALLLLKVAQNYSADAQEFLEAQRAETDVFMTQLRDLFPGYPMAYSALALDGMMDPALPEARRFNDGSLMHPLMVSLGVPDFLDCRIPARCDRVGVESAPISVMPFAGGRLELTVDPANIGIVRYRE